MRPEALPIDDHVKRVVRAAQYLRMSTEHQKYSTQNQAEAIATYAGLRNIEIVCTYADAGRSGLRLNGRDALQRLLNDVRSGRADFEFVLVYDVSRWGRFQDADESAYYEYSCKEAGIQVLYCAEPFENDGSLTSTILKNVKRAMAGEYSRDLSTKVFIGQCRITSLGFWHGGPASYGLRRQLVDEFGTPKAQLEYGQQKSLQNDRVVLKPGPAFEVETVRRVFKSFVTERKGVTEIAEDLNAKRIWTTRGNSWSGQTIDKILTNEIYVGNIVFNRTSFKLKQKSVVNPPEMWVRRDNALEAIIAPKIFARAQKLIAKRRQRMSDQEALAKLSALWRKRGHLSNDIIIAAKTVPDTSTYIKRFGSLTEAYRLIGFRPKPRYCWAAIEARIEGIVDGQVAGILSNIEKMGGCGNFDHAARLLTVSEKLAVSIGSARCVSEGAGQMRWHVRINRVTRSDLALVFKMNRSNEKIQEYYLLPAADLAQTTVKRLRLTSRVFSKSSRHDGLDEFYRICAAHIV